MRVDGSRRGHTYIRRDSMDVWEGMFDEAPETYQEMYEHGICTYSRDGELNRSTCQIQGQYIIDVPEENGANNLEGPRVGVGIETSSL